MHVLIVDDDPNTLEMTEVILRREDHATTTAANAAQALEAWLGGGPPIDLAIVDLGLPDLSGVELIRRLRGAGARTPILVCSAYVGASHRRDAEAAGCDHFLAKPIRRSVLLAGIERALAVRSQAG
jgi:CheY-like chemotaxis protein